MGVKLGNYNRGTDFPCPECPYITSRKFCYESHRSTYATGSTVRTRVDPASLVCPHCGKVSQTRSHHQVHLGKHARRDSDELQKHSCPSPGCNYSTANVHTFNSHRHYNHAPRTCPNCSFTCEGTKGFTAHQEAGCKATPSIGTAPPNNSATIHRCKERGCTYETPLIVNFRTRDHY